MRELKPELYRRNMEFRTNKIIRPIRQLGQCSEQSVCQYDADQMEQIFSTLQAELDAARRRFYLGKCRSLNRTFTFQDEMHANPRITLSIADKSWLTAVACQQDDYPSINIYLCRNGKEPELICFAEYNPERSPCHEICIGTYQSDDDETKYYAPYRAERNHNGTKKDLSSEETHMG